ncbi:Glutamate receptor ionotropic, kainate 1-like Protein [Tribolium castaneum]|uniref:Glutamate receptor ionotropic, kainate 1-like Protein n=1 Tax=Tribolium castaneum TaxID=7070 RepID=D6WHS0_TRICA|nr:PREDICTED: glutamate receptor ionotropic, kainate 2 isoform X1 [Tribolium castaneum]EFA00683.2 Glutamate receptor ionotropic, kainate 1-like Protein [Tribolium castaneum]|eukprot:XP_015833580.1 PREDICTED: glutamate receptor ionotropic, kainate 2 isoform X1 [Tribolium castaneum]
MLWGSWGATLGLAGLLAVAVALPPVVKIGAIFTEDQRDSATELAFKYAVYKINKDKTLLPYTSLVYDIQYVPRDDSFHASKKACNQVQHGVHAVFGPSDPLLGAHIHSICDALDIPHLEARLDLDTDIREFSINLHPAQHLLNTAFQDVMAFLNWTKVAIIYEEDYGLIKLRELVRSPHNGDLEIHLRQADPESYRAVLKEIKSKEIHNIVIDTKPSNMQHFLKGILQLQMNDYKYHYLFTTFDMETFDLEDFKYNFVNMTAFRVVDVTDLSVQEVLRDMARFQANINADSKLNSTYLQAEAALIYDSVFVFAIGLQTLEQSHTLKLSNVSCDKEQPWLEGLSLINYINAVEFKGLSGPIEFKEGRRIQFKLDLLKLKQHALVKVGEWRPGAGVNITDRAAFFDPGTMNVTLVVTTILEMPYVMLHPEKNYTGNSRFYGFCVDVLESISKEVGFDYLLDLVPDRKYGARDAKTGQWNGMVRELMQHEQPYVMLRTQTNVVGNERYEGFCIDLLKEIASMVGFEYRIELVPDSKYGVIDLETGEWNGIVRQLMDKKADLAVGSMTINYARESVIDFTKPFMNLGISILFKVPTDKESAFFSFFSPLGFDIWIFVGGAFFMSSFTLFTLARFTPYEWVYPQPWKRSKYLVNQLSMSNSFWFIAGTLLRQPSGVNPQVPTSQQARLFSFMNPLAMDIWMYVFSAYVLVSITMFVVARFSPYEWHNPHPCDMENELVENQFSLANSFWFTIGTLMQQGSDLNPKATSTRIVGGIWWFFTLIIISSYTANLAAFLTVERMITPIENAEDLAGQTEIPYGTLESGSTMTFFRDSMIETYKKMWRFMENRKPSVFVPTYEEGIQRVLEGNYAFLMESTMLDYTVQRDCNLTQIGGLLDSKGYGIATPMGSPWRDKISLAILELQEKGEIQMLYDKWWKNTGETCSRNEKGKESKANSLGVDNIGGVFVVLLCGLAFAVIIAICEFCYNSKKNALTEKRSASAPHQSLCSEMGGELCFALRCRGSRQRPALRRQCSKCLPGATYVPAMLDIPPHPPQPPSRPPPTNGLSAHVCPEDTSLRDRMMIPLELQHHMQPQHPLHQQLDN